MKLKLTLVTLGLLLCGVIGCSGKPADPVADVPASPPPPKNHPTFAGTGAAPAAGVPAGGAPASAPPPPSNSSATDNGRRNLPTVAFGGGGGGITSSAGGPNQTPPPANSAASGGLANGLYPQGVSLGGANSGASGGSIAGGLQNGIYPQFSGGSTSTSTAAAPAVPSPKPVVTSDNDSASNQAGSAAKLLDQAKELFAEGEDDKAANALYAYMLAKEDAYENYPLQWYAGIKEPLVFLRIGIGVTYTPQKGFSEKPPVIGDPVAGSKNTRRPPPGGDGDGMNSGLGGSNVASNSPYSTIDTTTPAGFLLYYTGDYTEKLYQQLNTRRKASKSQFGKILSQFPDRVPKKPPTQGDAAQAGSTAPQGTPRGNLPTFGIGGGGAPPAGGGGGGGGAAGGGGGGGGAAGGGAAVGSNAGGRGGTRKLVDQWSGSSGATPERLTTGTLMPGVICLGEGKKDDIISRAKKFGVDVVLLFDVKVGEAKGEKYSTTALRLLDPENPDEQLALGRGLNNTKVMESREGGKDPVETELARILDDYMDTNLIASKFPDAVNQDTVSKRLEGLLAGEVKHPLKTAVEVVGFYRIGLLKEAEVEAALKQLLSEDLAEAILNGDEGTRVTELQKLLEQD
jgi:hypothetical protein